MIAKLFRIARYCCSRFSRVLELINICGLRKVDIMGFLDLFDDNAREIRKYQKRVVLINSFEPAIQALGDDELRGKTAEFRERLEQGESLDDLLPEAFAVVREAGKRVINQRHYDVQLIGGMVLHEGRIAEMRTGEGKTLVSTLPAYLNALTGQGVHIVTVNDYLAHRDSEWMGQIHQFLGLSIGLVVHGLNYEQRKNNYAADITYGTNNEFGFDYLRDNMVTRPEASVQRELNYAIVDEVDSILIDEARTPLIISGEGDKPTELYFRVAMIIPRLKPEDDYKVIEKERVVTLTEQGVGRVESMLGVDNLYEDIHTELAHHINQALKAQALFRRDRDYVVNEGEVIIVDEFTGRLMLGRRYSNGLHQAIEAKEGLDVKRESKTLATITFQNYFRMYTILSGMTGTAKTEEQEFREIYGIDVIEIPTNEPVIRIDEADLIYKTEEAKYNAVINEIIERNKNGQPILVGTITIEKSELLSSMLKKRKIDHTVLNAKNHQKEAEIVAQAGRLGAVTIATNMAGRGSDIVLGGNPEFIARNKIRTKYSEEVSVSADGYDDTDNEEILEARALYKEYVMKAKEGIVDENKEVISAGGLCIIGTERHESRRIDNQLRGRAGRQGDPGTSKFYLSLEDELMRLFGGEKVQSIVGRLGVSENEAIEAGMLSKTIENAQKRVEGKNFSIRKYVLKYDTVMNKQREIIYSERRRVLLGEDLREYIGGMLAELADECIAPIIIESKYAEEWNLADLQHSLRKICPAFKEFSYTHKEIETLTPEKLRDDILEEFDRLYIAKEEEIGLERMRELERMILIRVVDNKWMDHIDDMDQLKSGIGLRAIGQQDPAAAYGNEGFDMFELMIQSIKEETVKFCYNVTLQTETTRKQVVKATDSKKYKNCCGR